MIFETAIEETVDIAAPLIPKIGIKVAHIKMFDIQVIATTLNNII